MRRFALLLTAALLGALLLSVPAGAFRLAGEPGTVRGNPAERLADTPADPQVYDRAEGCIRRSQPGTRRLVRWLERRVRGTSWGVYRCERWGEGRASLHAESRAIDWHLDARDRRERREGRRLIHLLLAPDRAGTPHALARRMGVQEIIWDCSYWGAGMTQFARYAPCYSKDGKRQAQARGPDGGPPGPPPHRAHPRRCQRAHLLLARALTRDGRSVRPWPGRARRP